MTDARLPPHFYRQTARSVAAALLGKRLVRLVNGRRLSGIIVETEAYCDAEELDLACHGDRANAGRPTTRTAIMFGPPGYAYVYFTYGMHWMFNIVTGEAGKANAVLLRALEPQEGIEEMISNRNGRSLRELTNGPAKLAQALAIDQSLNGANLCAPDGVIWVENTPGGTLPANRIATGPRIGLGRTPEPWLSIPWRFWIKDSPFVSR